MTSEHWMVTLIVVGFAWALAWAQVGVARAEAQWRRRGDDDAE